MSFHNQSKIIHDVTLPLTETLTDMTCKVHKWYLCIPYKCSNDLNGCSPFECHRQNCGSLECVDGCTDHHCRGCCYYSSNVGWCCPLFMKGNINQFHISPCVLPCAINGGMENTDFFAMILPCVCIYRKMDWKQSEI